MCSERIGILLRAGSRDSCVPRLLEACMKRNKLVVTVVGVAAESCTEESAGEEAKRRCVTAGLTTEADRRCIHAAPLPAGDR